MPNKAEKLEICSALEERMQRAYFSLRNLATEYGDKHVEFARLSAQAEGVALCLNYMQEAKRNAE